MTAYDVIVVGARCAGSPLALLLARRGHRVLLADRATFPSDTVSTHVVHPPGVAALARWGILDEVVASGCPPVHTYTFDLGPVRLAGAPGTPASPVAYAPRRRILDTLLVEAAAKAGAEVRTGFTVDELLTGDDGTVTGIRGRGTGGASVTEHARVVVGADGVHSSVARAVGAAPYVDEPPLTCGYYSYYSGLPMDGRFEAYSRPGRGWAAVPTNDGLTLVIAGWPYAELAANRADIEGNLAATVRLSPEFADRFAGARREERIAGATVPNFFRTPYGPGWALVGDAGYTRDFITAMGISDAFRDAELLAEALTDTRPDALARYQAARDAAVRPMFRMTAQIAALQPPPPEQVVLFTALAGNQAAMDAFARVNAGVDSPEAFFAPDNLGRLMAGAAG